MREWITGLTVVAIIAVLWWGLALADPAQVAQVCSGDGVGFEQCENARDRAATLGSTLVGAGIIAAAILGAALLVRSRRTDRSDRADQSS